MSKRPMAVGMRTSAASYLHTESLHDEFALNRLINSSCSIKRFGKEGVNRRGAERLRNGFVSAGSGSQQDKIRLA